MKDEELMAATLPKVKEFMDAFDMPYDDLELWVKLIHEEVAELVNSQDEPVANRLKEVADVMYVMAGLENVFEYIGEENAREPKPWDTHVFSLGCELVEEAFDYFGIDVVLEAFDRVHASNMSKLDDNGKPIRREDGKILKGPNYEPPYLDDLVDEENN